MQNINVEMWLPTHYIICIDDWFKLKLGKAEKVRYFLIWNLFRWNPCRRLLTTRSCTTPCATSSPSQSKKSRRSSSGFHLIFSGLVKVSLSQVGRNQAWIGGASPLCELSHFLRSDQSAEGGQCALVQACELNVWIYITLTFDIYLRTIWMKATW